MTSGSTRRYEYAIRYRRDGWKRCSPSKSVFFSRLGDAERYAAKLLDDGRPDLSQARVRRFRRPVGPWEEGWTS
jgi:hypothetical protein